MIRIEILESDSRQEHDNYYYFTFNTDTRNILSIIPYDLIGGLESVSLHGDSSIEISCYKTTNFSNVSKIKVVRLNIN